MRALMSTQHPHPTTSRQVAAYNIFAVYVTHFLSSVWHAILDNFRPISVWGAWMDALTDARG